MSILIVDILCYGSLYKIIKLKKRISIVYYCFLSKYASIALKPVSLFSRIQFKEFHANTMYKNKRSCYEEIETRITGLCDLYLKSLEDDHDIINYCRVNKLDLRLAKEHLRQNVYWFLYKPVEIMVNSELLTTENTIYVVLRDSPVRQTLLASFQKNKFKLYFYQYLGLSNFLMKREGYVFDVYIKETYLNNHLLHTIKVLREIVLLAVNSFCYEKLGKNKDNDLHKRKNTSNIGVDRYMNLAEEDCFWLKKSQIDPETIYYFEATKPSMEDINYLIENRINRIHIVHNLIEWFKKSDIPRQLIAAKWENIKRSIRAIMIQWIKCVTLYRNEDTWKMLMVLELYIAYKLWRDVFQQLHIKLLMSLSDIDPMNAAKAMAANDLDGVILGGHLSNHPLYSVSTERFYHVAFAWGPYFDSHIFGRYAVKDVVITGYYFDHEFKDYYVKADKIRMKYPHSFIITFMDNVFGEDLQYTAETMEKAYSLFFDIIDSYPQVVFFVKTKRAKFFNKARETIPAIDDYIRRKKIVPFINNADTNRPYKPACIALASDLVIGIGISSAATESQFAGVPSLHFDLPKTENNLFARNGIGVIVLRSVEGMREAIVKQLNQGTALTYEKIDHYYRDLDPFRDGRAAERIGTYLKWLLDGFEAGFSREDAMLDAANRYRNEWGYDKIASVSQKQDGIPASN